MKRRRKSKVNVKEYQEYVRSGASKDYTKEIALLGLMGEVGELADVVKKETIYKDMSKFTAKYGMSVNEKIADEAGDVLWQLINVLNTYGLDVEQVIDANVKKLNERHGGAGKTANDGGGVR